LAYNITVILASKSSYKLTSIILSSNKIQSGSIPELACPYCPGKMAVEVLLLL